MKFTTDMIGKKVLFDKKITGFVISASRQGDEVCIVEFPYAGNWLVTPINVNDVTFLDEELNHEAY